jgi:serine/threonine protein kinase
VSAQEIVFDLTTSELLPMNQPVLTVKSVFDQAHEMTSPAERQAFLDEACAGDAMLRQQVEALLQAYDAIRSGTFLQTPAVGLGNTGPYQLGPDTPREASLFDDPTVAPQPGSQPTVHIEGPGTQIGVYKLIKELGEGGMGAVFLAEQEHPIRRQVALKIIKPGMDTSGIVARFEAERQALTMMDHPNIARVYEAGTTADGQPYFVMELVAGIPMTRLCNDNHLTIRERLELFQSVCEAIQHAHAKGVMHRDIKPGNVLVALQDGKPVPKVIDFGLAKAIGQPLTDETQLTQVGAIVGTLEYMSPEQADPSGPGVDTATDIYSLGVMLYELLTGTTPLDLAKTRGKGDFLDVVLRIHSEEAPRPSARVAALADRLAKVAEQRKIEPARLERMLRGELDWIALRPLEKDRKRRYDTASAFARDVQRYLNDEPVEACPPTVGYRVGKFVRKNRGVLVSVVTVFVILTAGVVVSTWQAMVARSAQRTAVAAQEVMQEGYDLADTAVMVASRNIPKLNHEDRIILKRALEQRQQREPGKSQESRATAASQEFLVANISLLTQEYANAVAHLRKAIQLYENLQTEFPSIAKYRSELSRSYTTLAIILPRFEKQRPEVETALQRVLDLQLKLVDDFPDEADRWRRLADHLNIAGVHFFEQRDLEMAEKFYRAAITLGEKVAQTDPGVDQYRINLAYSYHNLGNAVRDQGKPEAAMSSYNQVAKLLMPIRPQTEDVLRTLRALAWDRANALGRRHKYADAIKQWRSALKVDDAIKQWQIANNLDDRTERPNLVLFMAADQSELNLEAQSSPAAKFLYDAAVVNARANVAAKRTKEASLEGYYTRRALELLKQAQAAGWFDDPQRLKQLQNEKSFESLPSDDFNRFLESLDAKSRKKD